MSVEIKEIVDLLKGPPFHRSEGLVDFSKKSPIELLQVVNDVFAEIDSQQTKDIREEPRDATAIRMLEFITVLGYKIEGDMYVDAHDRQLHSLRPSRPKSHTRSSCAPLR